MRETLIGGGIGSIIGGGISELINREFPGFEAMIFGALLLAIAPFTRSGE